MTVSGKKWWSCKYNWWTIIHLAGNAVFSRNEASFGGAIALYYSDARCGEGLPTIVLDGNKPHYGGGMQIRETSMDISICKIKCINNVAKESGGGISVGNPQSPGSSSSNHQCLCLATLSTLELSVGAQYLLIMKMSYCAMLVLQQVQGVLCVQQIALQLSYTQRFFNNIGEFGGAIYSLSSYMLFKSYNLLQNNAAVSGGAMYLLQGTMVFKGVTEFKLNSAERDGGAVYAVSTAFDIQEMINFTFNVAQNGGAVYLKGETLILLDLQTHFNLSCNTALDYGGGIYYVDNTAPIQCSYDRNTQNLEVPLCFIQFKTELRTILINFPEVITSYYNSAGIEGSFLYGGLLDRCQVNDHYELASHAQHSDNVPITNS